jgi:hypothetical protein
MNGVRKAALYLHGLEEADRSWLLNALSEEERESLHITLAELEKMGVPKGDAWLPELAEAQLADAREIESDSKDSEIDEIDRADLSRITQVLESEPNEVVAMLLKRRIWSWRQAYVSKLYLQKREQLLRALETPERPIKPKVEAALITALATRLMSLESESAKGFEGALADARFSEKSAKRGLRWSWLWLR